MTPPNSPAETAAATTGEEFEELAVANASFFIDKLGAECSDLQGLRALTVNGFEAIAALGQGAACRVVGCGLASLSFRSIGRRDAPGGGGHDHATCFLVPTVALGTTGLRSIAAVFAGSHRGGWLVFSGGVGAFL